MSAFDLLAEAGAHSLGRQRFNGRDYVRRHGQPTDTERMWARMVLEGILEETDLLARAQAERVAS